VSAGAALHTRGAARYAMRAFAAQAFMKGTRRRDARWQRAALLMLIFFFIFDADARHFRR